MLLRSLLFISFMAGGSLADSLTDAVNLIEKETSAQLSFHHDRDLEIVASNLKKEEQACNKYSSKQECQACCDRVCPDWNPFCFGLCNVTNCEAKSSKSEAEAY